MRRLLSILILLALCSTGAAQTATRWGQVRFDNEYLTFNVEATNAWGMATIIPQLDSTYDLGTSSKRWGTVYADSINATSVVIPTLSPPVAITGTDANALVVENAAGTDVLQVDTSAARAIISGDVGVGVAAPAAGLHGAVTNGALLWATNNTDNTAKLGLWGVPHYDVDEEPFYAISPSTAGGTNILYLGGGSASGNAATAVNVYAAANSTTTTGTKVVGVTNGEVVVTGELGINVTPGTPLDVYSATAGQAVLARVRHADNTNALSHATMYLLAGGASGGDSTVIMHSGAGFGWTLGLDNSDSDTFKISSGSAFGSNNFLTLTSAGETTLSSATVSDLTSGRVTYAGTSGELQDHAALTFNGSVLRTPGLTVNDAYTLPTADAGAANYVLKSDGAGTAAWSAVSIGWPISGGGANRVLYLDGSQQLATSGNFQFNGDNTLSVGADDTRSGILQLYGSVTGTDEGAQINLFTTADNDAAIDYFVIDVYQDDLRFFQLPTALVHVNIAGDTGLITLRRRVTCPLPNSGMTGAFNEAFGNLAGSSLTTGQYNTLLGYDAGEAITTGNANTIVGLGAGDSLVVGSNNTLVGSNAGGVSVASENVFIGTNTGLANTSGTANVAVGVGALETNITGNNCVAVGYRAANISTSTITAVGNAAGQLIGASTGGTFMGFQSGYYQTGGNLTVIGHQAGFGNVAGTGSDNSTLVGLSAGYDVTSGDNLTHVGAFAGGKNTTGTLNTSLGYAALYRNTTGIQNTMVGAEAGYGSVVGSNHSYNTGVGYRALYSLTTGSNNTAVGSTALDACTTGGSHVAIGYGAGGAVTTNSWTTAVGVNALAVNTAGGVVALGFSAGLNNTTGSENTYLGTNSGIWNQTGVRNTIVGNAAGGYGAGGVNSFSDATIVGRQAGYNLTTGQYNTAVGSAALDACTTGAANTAIGYGAGGALVSVNDGTFIGANAGLNSTAAALTFVGMNSGYSNTSGAENTVVGYRAIYYNQTGNYNTAVGHEAGGYGSGGANSYSNCVMVGRHAGYNITTATGVTIVGMNAGENLTTGSGNTLIGQSCGDLITTGAQNIIIGYLLDPTAADANYELNIGGVILGNTSAATYPQVRINGDFRLDDTQWEDLRFPANTTSFLGLGTDPAWTAFKDNGAGSVGVELLAFDDGPTEEEVQIVAQMPHSWKEGTDIEAHVHFAVQNAAGNGAGDFVEWGVEYTWANIGAVYGNTTILEADASVAATATKSGDGTLVDDKHYIQEIGTISGSGKTLSSVLIIRLFRHANDASDDYTGDAFLIEFDLHYEVNKLGSDTEYSNNF